VGYATRLYARPAYTELDGPSGPTAQQCHLNTKTALQLEAVQPRAIAIIAISSSVEFYMP
jgi:hypothetical protein